MPMEQVMGEMVMAAQSESRVIPRQPGPGHPENLVVRGSLLQPDRAQAEAIRRRGSRAWPYLLAVLELALGLAVVALLPHGRASWAVPLVWVAVLAVTDCYRLSPMRSTNVWWFGRPVLALLVLVETVSLVEPRLRAQLLPALLALVLLSVLVRVLAHALVRAAVPARVLLVAEATAVSRALLEPRTRGRGVTELVCVAVTGAGICREPEVPVVLLDDVPEAVARYSADAVLVVPGPGLPPERLRTLAWSLEPLGVDLLVSTGLVDVMTSRAALCHAGSSPVIRVRPTALRGWQLVVKGVWERAFGVLALVLTALPLALLMLAIRLDSPGPALFRQVRVGRDGKSFTMVKLRTMFTDAESRLTDLAEANEVDGGVLFKVRADPRVTRIGRFLRRYSLDEIPQLWNVVCGDMALVGPRPALPREVALYDEVARRRLAAKPGITGLWQVSGRSELAWAAGIRLDVHYVDNWSFLLDLTIVVRTTRAILGHLGAY